MSFYAWLWVAAICACFVGVGESFESTAESRFRAAWVSLGSIAKTIAAGGLFVATVATFRLNPWGELPLALTKAIGFSMLAFAAGAAVSIPISLVMQWFEGRKQGQAVDLNTVLDSCDFAAARDEFDYFFRAAIQEAKDLGKEVIFKKTFIDGWELFASNPCRDTADQWLCLAPDYIEVILGYFSECCPGGNLLEHRQFKQALIERSNSKRK